MDWKTFSAEIVQSLAWPSAIALIAWWFRSEIRTIVPRLSRIRHNETEVEFGQQTSIPGSELEANDDDRTQERSSMEYKILNTLWTKQINRSPDMSQVWTFRLNANAPQYVPFREASNRLIGEGLVRETNQGQIHLTRTGFDYCKKHYEQFPSDQWWPENPINKENLQSVLNAH